MTDGPISCNAESRADARPGRTRSRYEPGFFVPETLFDIECSTLLPTQAEWVGDSEPI